MRPGWHLMLRDLLWRMVGAGWDGRIVQVKEKMGCLWVYIEQDRDDLERMITLARRAVHLHVRGLWSDAAPEQRRQRTDVAL